MKSAPQVFKALNGVFCIYKPSGQSMKHVLNIIRGKLATDLNSMTVRPLRQRVVLHEENVGSNLPVATAVPDLADHPLVVGPRHIMDDFQLNNAGRLDKDSSGVVVVAIGDGIHQRRRLERAKYVRVYHVKGELGTATMDFSSTGKIKEKSTYYHVTHGKMDKVLTAMQAGHQKHQYLASRIDLQSQEAYELAATGLIRPRGGMAGPVVYGMKCIDFNPPHFTIELHSINESCDYLKRLIHELGLELRTSAMCTGIRRIRYGHFTLIHALLKKHWDAQCILENIGFCRSLVSREKLLREAQIQEVDDTEQLLIERSFDQNQ